MILRGEKVGGRGGGVLNRNVDLKIYILTYFDETTDRLRHFLWLAYSHFILKFSVLKRFNFNVTLTLMFLLIFWITQFSFARYFDFFCNYMLYTWYSQLTQLHNYCHQHLLIHGLEWTAFICSWVEMDKNYKT